MLRGAAQPTPASCIASGSGRQQLDEALGGFGTEIDVILHPDNGGTGGARHRARGARRYRAEDRDRPRESCSPNCTPAASSATALTRRGLRGPRASVVNALSQRLDVEVDRERQDLGDVVPPW